MSQYIQTNQTNQVKDPLADFYNQFEKFVQNNPNVISAARASLTIPESAKAVIILSPLSLKHVFARDWVSKSYKKNIVERPERLLATSMGISAAITMYPALFKLKSSNLRQNSLLSNYIQRIHGKNWPIQLINLCNESNWKLQNGQLEIPDNWNSGDIYLSLNTLNAIQGTIGAIEMGIDTIFKPVSSSSSSSSSSSNSSSSNSSSSNSNSNSTESDDNTSNRAFVAIRPPGHHCHFATPSGFCLINNANIAIEYAFENYNVTHAVVLDFDLHHGDGTQDICWKRAGFKPDDDDNDDNDNDNDNNNNNNTNDNENNEKNNSDRRNFNTENINENGVNTIDNNDNNDNNNCNNNYYNEFGKKFAEFPKVGYFSIHDINSFPTETGFATKENIKNASTCIMNSHDLNIWNVHLQSWSTIDEFNKLYRSKYRTIFAKADEFFKIGKLEMQARGEPFKGLVVISAGFDASEFEQTSMQRHNVNVPTEFYTMFTKDALKLAQLHCQGKVISLLEGGYSDKAIASGVFAHLIGLQNQDWIKEWGSEQVVKEIVRGCKPNWKPYKSKKSKDVIRIWAEEVINLGRSMIPEFKETIFNKINNASGANSNNNNFANEITIAQRITRSHNNNIKNQNNNLQKDIPFVEQDLSTDDEDDEDYKYDEALNKTFNKTVEDITIDDISRHLETLEIIQENHNHGNNYNNYDSKYSGRNAQYRNTSQQQPSRYRNSNPNNTNMEDTDISMISTAKHYTRSGRRW